MVPTYDLERARLVLSFGADFMETWLSPVEYTRGFGRSGSVDDHGTNKAAMVFLGPRLSLTGQNADEWFPIRPGSEAAVVVFNDGVRAYREGNVAEAAGKFEEALALDPELVNGYAEVNHNYEREHALNLWFVVTAADDARLQAVLAEIAETTGLEVLDLAQLVPG